MKSSTFSPKKNPVWSTCSFYDISKPYTD